MEGIAKIGRMCSPDLAPSDDHFFGNLKDGVRGTKFKDGTSLAIVVAGPEFYRERMQSLVPR
jgi:hypothetical protein